MIDHFHFSDIFKHFPSSLWSRHSFYYYHYSEKLKWPGDSCHEAAVSLLNTISNNIRFSWSDVQGTCQWIFELKGFSNPILSFFTTFEKELIWTNDSCLDLTSCNSIPSFSWSTWLSDSELSLKLSSTPSLPVSSRDLTTFVYSPHCRGLSSHQFDANIQTKHESPSVFFNLFPARGHIEYQWSE